MFLNKKAKEIEALLKQAKDSQEEKNKDEDIDKVLDLLNNGHIEEAVEFVKGKDGFDRQVLVDKILKSNMDENNLNTFIKALAAVADVPANEEAPKDDTVAEEAPEDLLAPEASLFDYLTKTAEPINFGEDTKQETPQGLSEQYKKEIEAIVDTLSAQDLDNTEILSNISQWYGKEGEDYAKEYLSKSNNTPAMTSIEDKTAKIDNILQAASSADTEKTKEDEQLDMAHKSASAIEWLKKVANKLDEQSDSPQHAGKEVFNDKYTSFGGGKSQQFPGQEMMNLRENANPEVVTVFNIKSKPDVDVYKDPVNRTKVTSISEDGKTIAFMQPLPLTDTVDITIPFNYHGIVGGEIQKQKQTKEPVAVAAHETNDYLDEIDKVSGGKVDKTKGDIPGITSEAFFSFGLSKKAEQVGDVGTDSVTTVNACGELGPEAVADARKTLKEKEDNLTASAGIEDTSKVESMVSQLEAIENTNPAIIEGLKSAQDLSLFKNKLVEVIKNEDPAQINFNITDDEAKEVATRLGIDLGESAAEETAKTEPEQDAIPTNTPAEKPDLKDSMLNI